MTFWALFKRWCTTKSFCLMWSHFEKWQNLWVVGLFPLSTNIIPDIVLTFFFFFIFLSIRGNTDAMRNVGILLKWVMTFSSLLSPPLNPTFEPLANFYELWEVGSDVSQKWITKYLNKRFIVFRLTEHSCYETFISFLDVLQLWHLYSYNWILDWTLRLPYEKVSNHLRRIWYINHRNRWTKSIGLKNTTAIPKEIKEIQHRPREVTIIPLLRTTCVSFLWSL